MLAWPARQHEAVAVGPVRVGRGVAQEARPEDVGHRRGAHRGARMAGVRLLDAVDGERPDGVDGEPVEVGVARVMRASSGVGAWGKAVIVGRGPPSLGPAGRAGTIAACRASDRRGPAARAGRAAGVPPSRPCRGSSCSATSCSMSCSRPPRPCSPGTDVPGRVALVAGRLGGRRPRAGSAGSGRRARLIAAVGRDAAGRALVEASCARTASRHGSRASPGRGPAGSASWSRRTASAASSRTAARPTPLAPDDLRAAWFAGADALHLPVYSLLGHPLGRCRSCAPSSSPAPRARSVSVDLASIGPLLAGGRRAARERIEAIAPDLLFATAAEAEAFLGGRRGRGAARVAAIAVVKRGAKGATVLARDGGERVRFEVATGTSSGHRHDRRRRRLRCRVPGRLVRGARGGPVRRRVAPSGGAGRPSGGGPPALGAAPGARALA